MEIALVLVAVFSVLVAVMAVVWAVRRPAPVAADPGAPVVDATALAQQIGAEVKAQVAETAINALNSNTDQFLRLAEERMATVHEKTKGLLDPLGIQMKKLDETVGHLRSAHEKDRGAVDTLTSRLGLQLTELQTSTTTLSEALRSRTARGVWGENQLRNVIELAGMESYCDFTEQTSGENRDGAGVRPDVLVRLPNGAHLAVDAKVPLDAYLRAQEATDQALVDRELNNHAKALGEHVKELAKKRYWAVDDGSSPEFVVLFVPGESFLADALRVQPTLLQEAIKHRVLLASPVNLLALLWAVAGGWQQARVNEYAREVADLGKELYERVGKILGDVETTGKRLNSTVGAFNELIGSIDSRLLVTMRRFPDLGIGSENLPEMSEIETRARDLRAAELPSAVDELPDPEDSRG